MSAKNNSMAPPRQCSLAKKLLPKTANLACPPLSLRKNLKKVGERCELSYSRDQLLTRLKEVVNKLDDKSFKVGEEPVGNLPESAALELKYKVRRGVRSLEIEIEWQDSGEEKQL
jgi:hypothetical protein